MNGMIFDIKRFAMHDGPGIRTTVFFKGCPLNCWWCHNPESLKEFPDHSGNKIDSDNSDSDCRIDNDLLAKEISVDELFNEIKKDEIFFDESEGGVTFSGGEPLHQIEFLHRILVKCRENDINTVVDTSGYSPYSSFELINDYVDLYLFDIKLINDREHVKFTNVSNENIFNNLKNLSDNGQKVRVRIPLIPGVTDTDKNITQIAEFLKSFNNLTGIDLLPYNKFAESKYIRINEEPKLGKLSVQSEKQLIKIKRSFEEIGLQVNLRG